MGSRTLDDINVQRGGLIESSNMIVILLYVYFECMIVILKSLSMIVILKSLLKCLLEYLLKCVILEKTGAYILGVNLENMFSSTFSWDGNLCPSNHINIEMPWMSRKLRLMCVSDRECVA